MISAFGPSVSFWRFFPSSVESRACEWKSSILCEDECNNHEASAVNSLRKLIWGVTTHMAASAGAALILESASLTLSHLQIFTLDSLKRSPRISVQTCTWCRLHTKEMSLEWAEMIGELGSLCHTCNRTLEVGSGSCGPQKWWLMIENQYLFK